MRKFLIITGIVLVVIVGVGLARDLLIKSAVITAAKAVAGVDVTVDRMSVSLLKQSVRVQGMKIYNPEGFSIKEVMADIPEIAVTLDVPALLKNILHLPYMRIHLKEIRVVKNKAGAFNFNSLKFMPVNAPKNDAQKAGPAASSPAPEIKMQLDLVSLNVEKVIIEDYTSGKDKPRVTVLEINMKDREFKNIKSPAELGSAVLFQALLPAGLDGLVSFGSRMIDKTAGKALDMVGGLFKGLVD